MKAKKILTGVLALAMIASLAACGGGGSAATPAPETSAPETTAPETSAPETTAPEGDGSLQRVLDAGKLGIGAEGNWIPYVYNEDGTGELTGFEVELPSRSPPAWAWSRTSRSPTAGIPCWRAWTRAAMTS